jgi:hypothetical protein
MSDNSPPPSGDPSGDPSGTQPQPGWGSAYPPAAGFPPHGSGFPSPGSGFPPPGYGYQPWATPPKHRHASTAMVLGIVSLVGGFLCWLPLVMAPFAWVTGGRALREIEASQGTQSGQGEALAGKVLGIIGTVLLALSIALIVLFVVLSLSVDNFWDEFWNEGYDDESGTGYGTPD